MKTSFRTLIRILSYSKKQTLLLVTSLLATIANVALTLCIPILIGNAIDNIIEKGLVHFEKILPIIIEIIIVSLIIALLQWLISIFNNKICYKIIQNIRIDAFNKLETLPLKTIDNKSQGELVNLIIADIQVIGDGLLLGFNGFFSGIMTILGTIGIMLSINKIIAVAVIVLTPISLFVAKGISKRTYAMFKKQAQDRSAQTAVIDEMIGNIKTVQSLNQETKAIEAFNKSNEELKKSSLKAIFFSSLVNPSTRFVNSLIYATVAIASALLTILTPYKISVGKLASLLNYANQYTKPFNEISGIISELQNAFACANRVFEFIDKIDEEKDKENAISINNPQGNLSIEHVYFSYTPEQKLIEDLNVQVSKGQKIAIVGPTGCGKTTLINLLMRFYDINSGKITVDNTNIDDITRKSLRLSYGMVLQDTWLRNDTIKNNLTLNDDSISDERIVEVCKICHTHNFIKKMPEAYNTIINEQASNLSTGQKQLLCIARVMLQNPSMLILDEATSNIDTRTEMKINEAFNHLMQSKTSFIVAHRLSTILSADLILVMKDGKIIEQGKHEELLSKNGFYTSLYNSQFNH